MERWDNSTDSEEERGERGERAGVMLMATAYKVYATILANRLEKEIEKKGIIPEWQAGFRKNKEVIDNIYTLNYLVGKEIERSKKVVQHW